jgi:Dolichyl-phosphate-mannose-protein mannosyltransferase
MKTSIDETSGPAKTSPLLGRSWERWTPLAAAALAVFYLATSIRIAGHRLLWFDELVTVLISQRPDASRIVDALAHVDNNMPAPYFLVVHWFFKLLGAGAVAARLPSALGLMAALLITFDCVRRLTNGLHGLIAMCVLGCSCLPYYGFEARSYGLYVMLAAFCLWIWVHGKRKYLSAVLFGVAFFLSIQFHYYAVLGLVPYAAWEALEWRKWRMPSAKLIAGGLAVCGAAAALVPQMSGAKRYSAVFWSPPSLFKLRTSFDELIPDGLFLLALVLMWIVFAGRTGEGSGSKAMEPAESVGWLGFLIPFAGYVVAREVTNAFVSRYFIGLLPGVAVAFSCWLWRRYRGAPLVAAGILVILGGFALETQLSTVRHPESIDPFNQQTATRQALQLESGLRAEGRHFTLLTNGLLYLELRYYAKHPEEYALLVPDTQYLETHNTARYTEGLGRYYPMQFWTLEDLRTHVGETALLGPTEETWKMLKTAGFETERRFIAPTEVDYLK